MKEVQLTRGKVAIVDDEDFELVSQWKWLYSRGYAMRYIYVGYKTVNGKRKRLQKTIPMARIIIGAKKREIADHINGDRLDNRRENLRVVNYSQNAMNRCTHKGSTSKYKGVCFNKKMNKWKAYIRPAGSKSIHLGYFTVEKDAALAYDEAAKKYFGEYARVNFPD